MNDKLLLCCSWAKSNGSPLDITPKKKKNQFTYLILDGKIICEDYATKLHLTQY